MINKRSLFKNKLEIDIIDILDKSNQPVKKRYRIDVDGSGVLTFAKKVKNEEKMLISINWKEKQSEILIFNLIEENFIYEMKLEE